MLADKGEVVEEWVDLRFFRPLGFRLASRLMPGRVTPDQVTFISLVLGLVAGHLFVYDGFALNALGLLLFIVSDIFDSADGQLARMRGSSTRFGRMLDGISDNVRFVNLYAHLIVRLVLAGWSGTDAVLLAVAAGVSHSTQSAASDFFRQGYLYFCTAGGEFDLPESLPPGSGPWYQRLVAAIYRSHVVRQAALFSRTAALARAMPREGVPSALAAAYRASQASLVKSCAWVAQNIRFALLAVTAMVGWPAGFFWLSIIPLNMILVVLVVQHERHAAQLLRLTAVAPALSDAQLA